MSSNYPFIPSWVAPPWEEYLPSPWETKKPVSKAWNLHDDNGNTISLNIRFTDAIDVFLGPYNVTAFIQHEHPEIFSDIENLIFSEED